MKYKCERCSFVTHHKNDYARHCKTEKHKRIHSNMAIVKYDQSNKSKREIEREAYIAHSEKMVCVGCFYKFSNRQAYAKHIKKCKLFINEMNTSIKGTRKEDDGETTKMALCVANNALKLVSTKFNNAPALEKIDHKKIERIMYSAPEAYKLVQKLERDRRDVNTENDTDTEIIIDDKIESTCIEEIIRYRHRCKQLDAYIGDGIIDMYKKNKPEDQSIWTSDVSRLTYLIRTAIDGGDDKWVRDHKGKLLTTQIIDPILLTIHEALITYAKDAKRQDEMSTDAYMDMFLDIADINRSICIGQLHKGVSRHIAPCFTLEHGDNALRQLL